MKLKAKYQKLSPQERLYQLRVPLIGLTGGIASGKSTVGKMLQQKGLALINADLLVKDIYSLPETFDFIADNYPDVIKNDTIQFPLLREKVFSDLSVKSQIEAFIYQRLPAAFMRAYQQLKDPQLVVYDVPLLFEKKLEPFFDVKVLVYSPRKVQRARLMLRDGHLESMADNILNQQMDIEEKKLKADFIIDNSQTEAELTEEINQLLRQICE